MSWCYVRYVLELLLRWRHEKSGLACLDYTVCGVVAAHGSLHVASTINEASEDDEKSWGIHG